MELQPLVSIVTPAYNEEKYLAKCIESVLAQTYSNWDYTIVNNCSTDGTLAVAQQYAARDPRIRVVSNTAFLEVNANHNHAFRQMSREAKYCKFVFADDWLFPACVEEMVKLSEKHPSIGLVGVYGTDGHNILWTGASGRAHELEPPYRDHCIPGREAGRSKLLGGPYVFGTMTSLLIRADLIRKRQPFLNEQNLHADHEICFDMFRESDFGFVHQVLSFHRTREQSITAWVKAFDSNFLGDFVILLKHGPGFLNPAEYQEKHKQLQDEYYRVLAKNVLRARPQKFWDYHRNTLAAFGVTIDRRRLMRYVFAGLGNEIQHPSEILAGAKRRCFRLIRGMFSQR